MLNSLPTLIIHDLEESERMPKVRKKGCEIPVSAKVERDLIFSLEKLAKELQT